MEKKNIFFLLFLFCLCLNCWGNSKVHHLDWEGIEVVWLEDERFPTYEISLYFADGALSDNKKLAGETEVMFDLIKAGTNRFNQKFINDSLDFYASSVGGSVFHEYSFLSISGLTKDLIPTVKMVCHLLKDSIFPQKELKIYKKRFKNILENIISSPDELADRSFRELTMKNTPFGGPTSGKIATVSRIRPKHLSSKLEYLRNKVKKRIYISGPKDALIAKSIILNECGFELKNSKFVRKAPDFEIKNLGKPEIFLIPLKSTNQAQIRIGRTLEKKEIGDPDLFSLLSGILGEGQTSILYEELREKRGLTYGAYAIVGAQRDYGRAVINTSTRNDKVGEVISLTLKALRELGQGKLKEEDLKHKQNYLAGRYLFKLERSSRYISSLIFYDHVGRSYEELYRYPEKIVKYTKEQVVLSSLDVFGREKLVIVVVGAKSLLAQLKKFGEVKIVDYHRFI